MHATPNNTGPRIACICLTLMPEAALRAEPDGFGLVAAVVAGVPPTPAVAVVKAGVVGEMILAVAVPVPDPMNPPPPVFEGDIVVLAEPFLSTILKLAQAMRVLLA